MGERNGFTNGKKETLEKGMLKTGVRGRAVDT